MRIGVRDSYILGRLICFTSHDQRVETLIGDAVVNSNLHPKVSREGFGIALYYPREDVISQRKEIDLAVGTGDVAIDRNTYVVDEFPDDIPYQAGSLALSGLPRRKS